MTTFTKNQRVKSISVWNDTVWYVRDAVVTACGKKQMALADAHTGKPIGRTFDPVEQQRLSNHGVHSIVKDCSMEEAKAIALAQSGALRDALIAANEAYLARMTERNDQWGIGRASEELAKLAVAVPAVATPYEPGHVHGPKLGEVIEAYKPRAPKAKLVVRHDGQIVGRRRSDRSYTHAVVVSGRDGAHVLSWHSSRRLAAQAASKTVAPVLGIADVEIA